VCICSGRHCQRGSGVSCPCKHFPRALNPPSRLSGTSQAAPMPRQYATFDRQHMLPLLLEPSRDQGEGAERALQQGGGHGQPGDPCQALARSAPASSSKSPRTAAGDQLRPQCCHCCVGKLTTTHSGAQHCCGDLLATLLMLEAGWSRACHQHHHHTRCHQSLRWCPTLQQVVLGCTVGCTLSQGATLLPNVPAAQALPDVRCSLVVGAGRQKQTLLSWNTSREEWVPLTGACAVC
jgi:hypothetical protein